MLWKIGSHLRIRDVARFDNGFPFRSLRSALDLSGDSSGFGFSQSLVEIGGSPVEIEGGPTVRSPRINLQIMEEQFQQNFNQCNDCIKCIILTTPPSGFFTNRVRIQAGIPTADSSHSSLLRLTHSLSEKPSITWRHAQKNLRWWWAKRLVVGGWLERFVVDGRNNHRAQVFCIDKFVNTINSTYGWNGWDVWLQQPAACACTHRQWAVWLCSCAIR